NPAANPAIKSGINRQRRMQTSIPRERHFRTTTRARTLFVVVCLCPGELVTLGLHPIHDSPREALPVEGGRYDETNELEIDARPRHGQTLSAPIESRRVSPRDLRSCGVTPVHWSDQPDI